MPISKSKRTARAASYGGLPAHPAMGSLDPLVAMRLGAEEPLRLPDMDNAPSASTVLRSEYTVNSDANGNALFGESFNLSGAKLSWTVTAGVAGTGVGTQHPQYTAFIAEARVARTVAVKVMVTYIGTTMEAAGYLSVSEKAGVADVDAQSLDSLHTGSLTQTRADQEVTMFLDYTQCPRWESPSTATFMQYTFPSGVFAASGLPVSKPVFRVRVCRFMEYLPVEGSLSEGELRHEPSNPAALAAHGELSGPATSVKIGSGDVGFLTSVKSIANAAYHMAQPMLPYVVPKARDYLAKNAWKAAPLLLGL